MPQTSFDSRINDLTIAVTSFTNYASSEQLAPLRGKVIILVDQVLDVVRKNPKFLEHACGDIQNIDTQGLRFISGEERDIFILADGSMLERRHGLAGACADRPIESRQLIRLYSADEILSGLEKAVADRAAEIERITASHVAFVAESRLSTRR